MKKTNAQIAIRVSFVTILWNVVLSILKLLVGLLGKSSAMLSDAVHSISDVISTVIVIIGVKMAGKEPDKEHPFGHERMECVAAVILAMLLFVTGAGIGIGAAEKIIANSYEAYSIPGGILLAAAAISILVKEGMYHYTKRAAKKTGSGALKADAWHHRSDALSSVGSLIGIAGAQLGFPILDALAGIAICILIIKVAVQIFFEAVGKMVDKACDETFEQELGEMILATEGVISIDKLKTRLFGDKIYVEVEICADSACTLEEAHAIAHLAHDKVESQYEMVKHCMIHVNPQKSCAMQDVYAENCKKLRI